MGRLVKSLLYTRRRSRSERRAEFPKPKPPVPASKAKRPLRPPCSSSFQRVIFYSKYRLARLETPLTFLPSDLASRTGYLRVLEYRVGRVGPPGHQAGGGPTTRAQRGLCLALVPVVVVRCVGRFPQHPVTRARRHCRLVVGHWLLQHRRTCRGWRIGSDRRWRGRR